MKSDVKDRIAIVDGSTGASISYGDLYNQTYRFAKYLKDAGCNSGDCIAIMSPNDIDFFASFHGAAVNGCIVSPINPLYTESEIQYQVDTTSTKFIISHPACLERVKTVATAKSIPVVVMGDTSDTYATSMADALSTVPNAVDPSSFDAIDPDSTVAVPFSSGTTGLPKGVELTHRNITSNMLQTQAMECDIEDHCCYIVPIPYFHIYGLVIGLLYPVYQARKSVFLPSFDFVKFLELIQTHKVTRAFAVPPIVLGLAKHPIVEKFDLSSLITISSGAAPLGTEVQVACASRLKCKVAQGWGMTEISPVGTMVNDTDAADMSRSAGKSGRLLPGTEARIMDPTTEKYIDPGTEGELLIRGPQVMKGYYRNPEATSATIRSDGFMHTGDMGYFDSEGWLEITGRIKELIKYKGFQIAPAELEDTINTLEGVQDVMIIPVDDEEAGEVPRAYVVKQEGANLTEEDILAFVKKNLSPHKQLKGGVRFIASVPRAASGKLLRRELIAYDRENSA